MPSVLAPEQDLASYRKALGCFATGVAIVTTATSAGEFVGLTVNSFASVSLDPPLVLWSLRCESSAFDIFRDATHFAVNVLAREQTILSSRFATRDGDKFEGLLIRQGAGHVPLMPDCVATFECRTQRTHIEGDHALFIGRVEGFTDRPEAEPLIYCRGTYASMNPLRIGPDGRHRRSPLSHTPDSGS